MTSKKVHTAFTSFILCMVCPMASLLFSLFFFFLHSNFKSSFVPANLAMTF